MPVVSLPALPGLIFPVTRSNLGFDVDAVETLGGIRTTFPNRAIPRYQWAIGFEMLRSAPLVRPAGAYQELETLAGFYNSRFGRAYPFAYRDILDNAVTAQGFGVGDGATRRFQLVRTFGGFTEPVRVVSTIRVFLGGVEQDPAGYSVGAYGRLTFAVPPAVGAVLTWTGTFAWLCRFDDDRLDFTNFMSGYWSLDKITFSSEILP